MEKNYYNVEWIDSEGSYRQDTYFPLGTNVISTSFYHPSSSPGEDARARVIELMDNGIKTVKYEKGVLK
jgi:hypothetical protein